MSPDPVAPSRTGLGGPLRLLVTTAICLAIDLLTKHLAATRLDGGAWDVIPGWLQFTYVENRGAVFGLGQGRQFLFICVSAIAIGFVTYLFTRPPRRWWYDITLGMLLAGILGNLYDRVFFGHVRDMIHALPDFHWGGTWQIPLINYPPPPDRAYFPWVFNVADSLLCVSIAILLITGLFMPDEHERPDEKQDDTAADKPGT